MAIICDQQLHTYLGLVSLIVKEWEWKMYRGHSMQLCLRTHPCAWTSTNQPTALQLFIVACHPPVPDWAVHPQHPTWTPKYWWHHWTSAQATPFPVLIWGDNVGPLEWIVQPVLPGPFSNDQHSNPPVEWYHRTSPPQSCFVRWRDDDGAWWSVWVNPRCIEMSLQHAYLSQFVNV